MILTWLWKMLLWFKQDRGAPLLEAPKPALGDDLGFVNHSTDNNNSQVVIFEGDAPPPSAAPLKGS